MHGLAQNLSFFNYNLIRNKEGGSKDDHLNVELVNKNLLKTTFSLSEDSSQDELEARLLAAIWAVVDFSNIQDLSIIASQKTSSDALNAIGEYIS
ncbi:MAG: hypothetical protein VW397_07905, partial [Candidatus Margulisiibacteriota bacterium]